MYGPFIRLSSVCLSALFVLSIRSNQSFFVIPSGLSTCQTYLGLSTCLLGPSVWFVSLSDLIIISSVCSPLLCSRSATGCPLYPIGYPKGCSQSVCSICYSLRFPWSVLHGCPNHHLLGFLHRMIYPCQTVCLSVICTPFCVYF